MGRWAIAALVLLLFTSFVSYAMNGDGLLDYVTLQAPEMGTSPFVYIPRTEQVMQQYWRTLVGPF